MTINWEKAPEGAEAATPECSRFFACWYRRNKWGEVEVIIEGGKVDWVHMGSRRDFPYGSILRPKP
jgi:hypothetical protein